MNNRKKYLLLASLVPVLILIGMTVLPLFTLMNGKEIKLRTLPVDPADPFRGDYVSLRYEAEEIPVQLVEKEIRDRDEVYNLRVYVSLEEKDGVYQPTRVSLKKPKTGVYLKGKLKYFSYPWDEKNQKEDFTKKISYIEYSMDKFFVEDNTGLEWEKASAKGDILATVKVFNGYAYLTDIELIDK
jgi:uncharacterized membrane-anchored protein